MSGIEVVTPSQIIEAIKYAQSLDKNDKFGDKAFKVDLGNIKNSNGVKFIGFEILKKQPNNTWNYVPLNIKFMNLNTKSTILPPVHEKRKFPGVQLQFAGNAVYNETENYGEAKVLIAKAFTRIMKQLLKSKQIHNSNTKISTPIQFDRLDKSSNTGIKIPLDIPIIRVDIKFKDDITESDPKPKGNIMKEKSINPTAKPVCDIYNVTKKILSSDPRYDAKGFNFEPLKFNDALVTYETIGNAILSGSSVSGVDSMSSINISNMGISLPSKASLLMVKPSRGFRPDPNTIFNKAEIDSFVDATVEEDNDEDDDVNNKEKEKEKKDNNTFDNLTFELADEIDKINNEDDDDDDDNS